MTIETLPVEADDAATICHYSDRNAATIITRTDKRITVRQDNAKLLNGANSGEPDALHFEPGGFCGHTSGTQRWEYRPNPEAGLQHFSLRANGKWVQVGTEMQNGTRLIVGARREHYDFNF